MKITKQRCRKWRGPVAQRKRTLEKKKDKYWPGREEIVRREV